MPGNNTGNTCYYFLSLALIPALSFRDADIVQRLAAVDIHRFACDEPRRIMSEKRGCRPDNVDAHQAARGGFRLRLFKQCLSAAIAITVEVACGYRTALGLSSALTGRSSFAT